MEEREDDDEEIAGLDKQRFERRSDKPNWNPELTNDDQIEFQQNSCCFASKCPHTTGQRIERNEEEDGMMMMIVFPPLLFDTFMTVVLPVEGT